MKPTKRTRSQERILALLGSQKRSLSAQDIYMELQRAGDRMGLATVYRALDALKLEGALQVRTLETGESLYCSIERDKHHFTCLQCGVSVPIHACPVRDFENRLRQSQKFKVFYHTLEFFGLCTNCDRSGEG